MAQMLHIRHENITRLGFSRRQLARQLDADMVFSRDQPVPHTYVDADPAAAFTMRERQVNRVTQIIEPVEIIARPFFAEQDVNYAAVVEIRVTRQRRRTVLAKKHEYEPQILFGRIAADLDLRLERRVFARLFDALPRRFIFPAVIETAYAIALHRARRELLTPIRAAKRA